MPEGITLIDIVVLIAVGFGAVKGLSNGIIKELAGIIGLIIGIWAGLRLGFLFADYYKANFDMPENIIPAIGFITAFALAMAGVIALGRMLRFLLKKAQLSPLDKAAGAAFGILKWSFVVGSIFAILGKSGIVSEETKSNSLTYPYVTAFAELTQEYTLGLIPAVKNVFTEMDGYFDDLETIRQKTNPAPTDSLRTPQPNDPGN